MYYEDVCTLRYKELSSGVVAKSFKGLRDMKPGMASVVREAFLCQTQISIVVASGVFLVAIRILGQRYLPHFPTKKHPVNSSDMISIQHQSMESCEQKDEIFPESIVNGLCLLRKKEEVVVLSRDGKLLKSSPQIALLKINGQQTL
ncbi:hypothetical protein P3S67_013548 [Capsicum chacoense]